jgi:hypothetical protein
VGGGRRALVSSQFAQLKQFAQQQPWPRVAGFHQRSIFGAMPPRGQALNFGGAGRAGKT